jgi:trehalose/maltose transport system substrate-binding protein
LRTRKTAYKKSSPWFIAVMNAFPPVSRVYNSIRRNSVRLVSVFIFVIVLAPTQPSPGETVRFAGDSDLVGDNGRWTRAIAEEWAQKTNNTVEYISRPADATATLQLYLQYWGSKSADVDVYMVDVIWQGIAAPHAVDLS